MSSYRKITRHPQTGQYESAFWIDDYFGPHLYGVQFDSDNKTYPADLVNSKAIKHYWAADVVNAYMSLHDDFDLIDFLNEIEVEYKNRWKSDPLTGNGATLPCEHEVVGGECIHCRIVIEDES